MKFRLVKNWRDAWKWASTRIFIALAAIPVVWAQLPPEQQAMLPEEWRPFVLMLIALGGVAGRLRDGNSDA